MWTEPELQQAFVSWVMTGPQPERAPVPAPSESPSPRDRQGARSWPVSAILFELWESTGRLPGKVRVRLGLPAGATFGHAAQLLWWLRTGEEFPCSSYAEAVAQLRASRLTGRGALYRRISAYLRHVERTAAGGAGSRAGTPTVV